MTMIGIIKEGENSVTVLGVTYTADENGIIHIPKAGFSSEVFGRGWVSSKGYEQHLAREAAKATNPEGEGQAVVNATNNSPLVAAVTEAALPVASAADKPVVVSRDRKTAAVAEDMSSLAVQAK
ncbi:hypothetical protein [Methylovulum psychrotolerans]|uniref:Uncharacterized protein n=1 Tax=Methylovulum psychrotolerans TaxID=1704499 RepID=A0A1Z4C0D3_9GAMM|nr:hypothetical protein [Methylovulum psychrotolerans]ASF46998.1 hypothetical protein CEK71_13465 [Methylovulum psychrotolerans]